MAILDEVLALNKKHGPACGWQKNIGQLLQKDQDELNGVLASTLVTNSAVSRWLESERGVSISQNVIAHHRKGACSCPK